MGSKNDREPTEVSSTKWEAPTLSKRRGERFYLVWSAIWMTMFAGIVVTGVYEYFDEWSYMFGW